MTKKLKHLIRAAMCLAVFFISTAMTMVDPNDASKNIGADGDPFTIYVDSSTKFKDLLETNKIAKATRTYIHDRYDYQKAYKVGEARGNTLDGDISKYSNSTCNNPSYGYTPVVLLKRKYFDVYMQFVKTTIGVTGIVKGVDDEFHCVYPNFLRIFASSKYECYGLPIDSYKVKSCGYCNESYVYQDFMGECEVQRLYAWTGKCTATGTHHDYLNLSPIAPCGADDGINIGSEFIK